MYLASLNSTPKRLVAYNFSGLQGKNGLKKGLSSCSSNKKELVCSNAIHLLLPHALVK